MMEPWVIFDSTSERTDRSLKKFQRLISSGLHPSLSLLGKKMDRCDYQVVLIADDQIDGNRINSELDLEQLETLSGAWRSICREEASDPAIEGKSWVVIDQIGEPILFRHNGEANTYLQRFREEGSQNTFFILLSGNEQYGLPALELYFLCNHWQLEHDALPIHAAGVIHNGRVYLFAGPSGIGKSTISALSQGGGDWVLDEDQVLIHQSKHDHYSADGWGYTIVACEQPIQAIFLLVQDSADSLIPLDHMQVARRVLERHNEVVGDMLSPAMFRQAFRICSDLARQVSGYELHFRKTPDFWQMIDEQFPA